MIFGTIIFSFSVFATKEDDSYLNNPLSARTIVVKKIYKEQQQAYLAYTNVLNKQDWNRTPCEKRAMKELLKFFCI